MRQDPTTDHSAIVMCCNYAADQENMELPVQVFIGARPQEITVKYKKKELYQAIPLYQRDEDLLLLHGPAPATQRLPPP